MTFSNILQLHFISIPGNWQSTLSSPTIMNTIIALILILSSIFCASLCWEIKSAVHIILKKHSTKNLAIMNCINGKYSGSQRNLIKQESKALIQIIGTFQIEQLRYLAEIASLEWYSTNEDFLKSKVNDRIVLVNFACNNTIDLIEAASLQRLFNGSHHWVFYGATYEEYIMQLDKLDINYDTKITVLLQVLTQVQIHFYNVWSPSLKRNGGLEVNLIGVLNSSRTLMSIRRRNLNSIYLRTATVVSTIQYYKYYKYYKYYIAS